MLVLPWHAYLPFPWNRNRVVLDPAGQFFPRRAVTNTAIEVGGFRLPPEDPWTTRADPLVRETRPLGPGLGALGVRYVLVLKTADWRGFNDRLMGLDRILDAPELSLYRLSAPNAIPTFSVPSPPLVIAADIAALCLVVIAAVVVVRRRIAGSGEEGTLARPEPP
jgi:hypothetical protein